MSAPGTPAAKDEGDPVAALQGAPGRLFVIDPAQSEVRIYVFRAGRLARLGHNHVLSAPRFVGAVAVSAEALEEARFALQFRLDELAMDETATRAAAGEGFGSLDEADAAATRAHMLGEEGFDAGRYPFVRLRSESLVGTAAHLEARVRVELHGRTRSIWLPLGVSFSPGALAVQGQFVILQSDFGVQPYAALGGLLAVQDPVLIAFTLRGRCRGPACTAPQS